MKCIPYLSLIFFLCIVSCSKQQGTEENSIVNADSIARADSLRKVDSVKLTTYLFTVSDSMSCEDAQKAFIEERYDTRQIGFLLTVIARCKLAAYNAAHPGQEQVILYSEEVVEGTNKIFFNLIPAGTAEDIEKGAKIIGAMISMQDPTKGVVANFTIESYVKMAKKNDPLIIFLPTVVTRGLIDEVENNKVTGAVWKKASLILPTKQLEVVENLAGEAIKEGAGTIKKDPTIILAPGMSATNKAAKAIFKKIF